ncbi:hypothetical protein ACIQOW_14300 [Kitasatospora sp. NPDC091335]|uniref:hypothetical protein n=1 Tax=Streptomycetaceae TaxID=2062 RepID=UPI001661DC09|nr:hypothetical protein [Streptomyces sp. CBMA156]MBD0671490.1 hypothetical protein [Streptomyces sp. CBMA156]
MAEQLNASADLQNKFKRFARVSEILDDIGRRTDEINTFNKESAGHDEIGKTYHDNVDGATADLFRLFRQVSTEVEKLGLKGQRTSVILQNAEDDAKGQV